MIAKKTSSKLTSSHPFVSASPAQGRHDRIIGCYIQRDRGDDDDDDDWGESGFSMRLAYVSLWLRLTKLVFVEVVPPVPLYLAPNEVYLDLYENSSNMTFRKQFVLGAAVAAEQGAGNHGPHFSKLPI